MWILYFDHVPKYRFGAVKQQIWMALHLPFHLAILGVVEGSQQLAQAHYIYSSIEKMAVKVWYGCVGQHMQGQALTANLTKNIEYFKLNESARGREALQYVWDEITILGNTPEVCSPANTSNLHNDLYGIPMTFSDFIGRAIGAMIQALDVDIPPEGERVQSAEIALRSWIVVYTYFWSALILLLVCYTITSLLADAKDGQWNSVRKYTSLSIVSRAAMIIVAVVLLVLGQTSKAPKYLFVQHYLASPWILPTVVLLLWIVCLSDRGSKMWRQRREKKATYESVAVGDGERHEEQEMGAVRRRGTNAYGYPSHAA